MKFLSLVPDVDKQLGLFRKKFGSKDPSQSVDNDFNEELIQLVSKSYVDVHAPMQRIHSIKKHFQQFKEINQAYDSLYGLRVRDVTLPFVKNPEKWEKYDTYAFHRFLKKAKDPRDPDLIKHLFLRMLRIYLTAKATITFYGNPTQHSQDSFDAHKLYKESKALHETVAQIIQQCQEMKVLDS